MKPQVQEFRESLAKSLSLSIEDVPEWQVKTPLQRAIQILKSHRDVRFQGDPENRPVSIILITLPEITSAEHSEKPAWPMLQVYRASIKASLHYAKNTRRISELARRKITKKLWIKFVAETPAPYPYKVFWKVVNNGSEAREAAQLRGKIFEDSSSQGNVLWEHTLLQEHAGSKLIS
jgi:Adenylyl/Guanylyl and SMODS C-terminal sensor domain